MNGCRKASVQHPVVSWGMQARRPLSALVVALASFGACGGPLNGDEYDPASAAPALELAAPAGGTFRLSALRDTTVLLFFGYTHCPDVCPTTLADWAQARRLLGAEAGGARFVFVSVDPERDSPEEALAYAQRFDSSFAGVVATDAQLARLRRDWGIAAYPEGDTRSGEYLVAHPGRTFVVDREGRLRLRYSVGTPAAEIASDLRRLR
jgi:protein SCO1/2